LTPAARLVPIHEDVIQLLSPGQQADLETVVNEAVEYLAALQAQSAEIQAWEAEHGEIPDADLDPYLEAVDRTLARAAEDQRRFAAKDRANRASNGEAFEA
jgi:hypothetical protein